MITPSDTYLPPAPQSGRATLPIEHEDDQDAQASASTILLAEDNETNIVMIGDYLSSLGYRVIVTRNGAEALARAREALPELIVMDVQMPVMDGLEATRRIRAESRLAAIPIVALTALAMPGDREKCIAAGANDYLSKPVSLRGLAATIEAHIRQAYGKRRNLP